MYPNEFSTNKDLEITSEYNKICFKKLKINTTLSPGDGSSVQLTVPPASASARPAHLLSSEVVACEQKALSHVEQCHASSNTTTVDDIKAKLSTMCN